MPELAIKDIKNNASGSIALPDEHFGIKGREALLHAAVVNYLANRRQGTHATKTRGKVRGGGRKPYRQKGTGRSRAGSIRSPIWRGGGIVFGPQPRDYRMNMPKQARRRALYAALSAKIADGEVVVVDALKLDEPKTRRMIEVIENLEISEGSLLVVLSEMDANVALSVRNIPGVRVMLASDLNAYEVLVNRRLLCTRGAVEALAAGVEK
jgi:large subunit ribosomal protein L4